MGSRLEPIPIAHGVLWQPSGKSLKAVSLSGGVKELGFWEVNSSTLQDVHEVAPTQEEMQAAAEGKAPAEADKAMKVSFTTVGHGAELATPCRHAQSGSMCQSSESLISRQCHQWHMLPEQQTFIM